MNRSPERKWKKILRCTITTTMTRTIVEIPVTAVAVAQATAIAAAQVTAIAAAQVTAVAAAQATAVAEIPIIKTFVAMACLNGIVPAPQSYQQKKRYAATNVRMILARSLMLTAMDIRL